MMRHLPTPLRRTTFPLLALSLLLPLALLSACGSSNAATGPTATPKATATATPEPGTFYFTTDDGVTLSGKIVGSGATAIVLSAQDGDPGVEWAPLASQLADRGYLVMTYNYRGIDPSQGRYIKDQLDHDLRAAIAAAQAKGATKIVLMGASLGGLVTAKVAATAKPTAVVILSAPASWGGMTVTGDEMAMITAPKLFVASQNDHPFSSTVQQLYDASPQPKQIHIYPGNSHGVDFFGAPDIKADFLARLFAFLDASAPAK
jgi:dipeptidyl aminopeptidase/acylaminoacyl peptidase